MMTAEQIAGLATLLERATKGPLIVDDFGDITGHATRVAFPDKCGIPSEGVGLAFQNWKEAEDKNQRISWATAEANAKLWAMAPDLAAEVLRLTATVADLTAANTALAAECARLKAREVEARGVIASVLSQIDLIISGATECKPDAPFDDDGLPILQDLEAIVHQAYSYESYLTAVLLSRIVMPARAYLAGGAE